MKKILRSIANYIKQYFSSDKHNVYFAIGFVILIMVFSLNFNFKIDLTRNNSYSLSGYSEELVSNLEDPVYIKVFYSNNVPPMYQSVKRYLIDLLEEYKLGSSGNLKIEYYDVDNDSDLKAAGNYGLHPVEINTRGADEMKVQKAYMGIVIIHGDLIERINSVRSVVGIEYRISSTIQKMLGKSNTLKGLDKKIKIKVFVSPELENFNINGYEKYKEIFSSLFNVINEDNYNKLDLEFVNCSELDDVEEVGKKYGLPVLPWERTKMGSKIIEPGKAVLGAVVELENEFRSVPLGIAQVPLVGYSVTGYDNLEKKIRSSIDSLLIKNPKVAYLTGNGELPLNDNKNGAGYIKAILSDLYQVVPIDAEESNIPADIGTLIINAPKRGLSEIELFKIDQFLMRGGSLLVLQDPFNEVSTGQANMMQQPQTIFIPVNNNLEKLLKAYGFSVGRNYVMDSNCYSRSQQGQGKIDFNYIPILKGNSISNESEITKNIRQMIMVKTAAINIDDGFYKSEDRSYKVLLKSSGDSWLMKERINLNPFAIYPPNKDQMKSYNLAVSAEGSFDSAFADGKINGKDDTLKTGLKADSLIKRSLRPGRIVLISSGEMSRESLLSFQDADGAMPNIIFMQSVVDYLNNNEYIAAMRSKGLEYVPIEDVSMLERSIFKIFNIAGLPFIVIVCGLIIRSLRKRRQRKILETYSGGTNE